MSIKVSGKIPDSPLYRFFSADEHASAFVSGKIWFGWLKKYVKMGGNIREDISEGTAEYNVSVPDQTSISFEPKTKKAFAVKKPGVTKVTATNLNHFYILCASEVQDEDNLLELRKRFCENPKKLPKYVQITDVKQFTKLIQESLSRSEYAPYILGIKWFKVEYSKGKTKEKIEPEIDIDVYQKPAQIGSKDFTCENEWRLAVFMKHEIEIVSKKNGEKTMFVHGEEREERIAKYLHMTVDELKECPDIVKLFEKEIPYWIENIIIEDPAGLTPYAELKA